MFYCHVEVVGESSELRYMSLSEYLTVKFDRSW